VASCSSSALPAEHGGELINSQLLFKGSQMPISRYQNQTLTGQVFQVEESWFVNCTLVDCKLFYSGGRSIWENTSFQNCEWKFHDKALATIQLLNQIGLLKPNQMMQAQPRPSMTGPVN
jgi:hypothetical protein